MSDAELRMLLLDCLGLWGVAGQVEADGDCVTVTAAAGAFAVRRAEPELRPLRWLLQTPERAAAGRPARAVPSVVALLTALRHALGAEPGNRLRIAAGSA